MFLRGFFLLTALCLTAGGAGAQSEEPSVVVFCRHTFRGINLTIGPQRVSLPPFQIDWPLPMLGYGFEATAHGLTLAQKFGGPALLEASSRAVGGLGKTFHPHWDEFRCDLASSRDFFTGLSMRAGLPAQSSPILMTGCPTREGAPVDAVTVGAPVRTCVPPAEIRKLLVASPNQERVKKAGEELLAMVGQAIGRPGPFPLPLQFDENSELRAEYVDLTNLASALEMVSEEGPPLARLFPHADPARLRELDPGAVQRASNFLGVRFTSLIPMELAYASSVLPVEYINSIPPGRHVATLSHDDDLSTLLRALGLVADDGNPDELAVLPMESIVFALDQQKVCIVRMRMQIAADGSLPGPFSSRIVWQGTRAQWGEKVQKVVREAQAWPAGAAERAKLRILPAPSLDVLYSQP